MADKEINDLTDGGAAASGDLVHVVRSGNSRKITLKAQLPTVPASSAGPASMEFAEDTDNGSNKATLSAPSSLSADAAVVLPSSSGTLALIADLGMSTIERRNMLLGLCDNAKALASYRRYLDTIACGFKASGDADATSTGITVDTAAGAVKPASIGGTTTIVATGAVPSGAAGYTLFNLNTALTPGAVISGIIITQATAATTAVKIGKRNSAGNFDIVVSEALSHPGGGDATKTLSSPYTVPGSGSYYVGAYIAASPDNAVAVNRGFKIGDLGTGTGITGFAEDTGNGGFAMKIVAQTTNGTLITPYQTADAARTKARCIVEIDPVDAATLGTDVTIEMTCNGGANWTAAGSYTNCGKGQSGRTVVETDEVTCTSGTSFAARIKNLNNKNVHFYKAAVKVAA